MDGRKMSCDYLLQYLGREFELLESALVSPFHFEYKPNLSYEHFHNHRNVQLSSATDLDSRIACPSDGAV